MQRQLRQLSDIIDQVPPWGQALIAVGLICFSLLSIYGRINTTFGAKIFSKIPEKDIRTNKAHITQYTVIPVMVTISYLFLLADNE